MIGVVVVNDVQNLDDRGTMKTNTSMKNINLILIQEIMFFIFSCIFKLWAEYKKRLLLIKCQYDQKSPTCLPGKGIGNFKNHNKSGKFIVMSVIAQLLPLSFKLVFLNIYKLRCCMVWKVASKGCQMPIFRN